MARAVKRKAHLQTRRCAREQGQGDSRLASSTQAGGLLAKGTYSSRHDRRNCRGSRGLIPDGFYAVFRDQAPAGARDHRGWVSTSRAWRERAAEFAQVTRPRGLAARRRPNFPQHSGEVRRSLPFSCGESGDPQLFGRAIAKHQTLRLTQEGFLPDMLARRREIAPWAFPARGPGG